MSFDKILHQWEKQQQEKRRKAKASVQNGPRRKSPSMDEWLDMYPPDRNMQYRKETPDRVIIHTEKKRLARMEAQDSIDLHGMTGKEAMKELKGFLESAKRRGYEKVLVVHGRGLHSPGGRSVLRPLVKAFLEKSPLVKSFGNAKGTLGGRGASWILLR